jgi:hypothetical protein
MEWMSMGARGSNWDHMLYNLNPLNQRPGHTHTLGTNILGNLLLWDSHLVRCGRSSEVEHVALEVLTEANFCCLYSAAGVGVTSAAAWSPASAAATSTAASSSPTTHCEE